MAEARSETTEADEVLLLSGHSKNVPEALPRNTERELSEIALLMVAASLLSKVTAECGPLLRSWRLVASHPAIPPRPDLCP